MVEAALLKGYSGTRGGQMGGRDVRTMGQIRYKGCLSIPSRRVCCQSRATWRRGRGSYCSNYRAGELEDVE